MCQKLDFIAGLLRTLRKAYNNDTECVDPLNNSSMHSFHLRSFQRPYCSTPNRPFFLL